MAGGCRITLFTQLRGEVLVQLLPCSTPRDCIGSISDKHKLPNLIGGPGWARSWLK